MDKRDYIDLIKVTEGIIKLEKGVEILSGKSFEEGEGVSVYYLWEILRRNASEKFWYSDEFEDDRIRKRELLFRMLFLFTASPPTSSFDFTPEEKYERLTA